MYRIKVEEREADARQDRETVLALHVYKDGVEIRAFDFELSPAGARGLIDEVRWLEWKDGS